MTDSVHKDNVVSFKKRQRGKEQVIVFAVHFIAIGNIFDFFDYNYKKTYFYVSFQ